MPTVVRWNGYRFFFYSNEGIEPKHIHVEAGDGTAKFWLDPVQLVKFRGFNERELKQIEEYIRANLGLFVSAWDEYFGV